MDLVTRLKAALSGVEGVTFAYLFGSQARGTARPDSDIDLAVHPASGDLKKLHFALFAALSEQLPSERIHLVFLTEASPGLVVRMANEGVLLVDHDPTTRVRFIAKQAGMYQDMEHVRRMFAEADARRVGHG